MYGLDFRKGGGEVVDSVILIIVLSVIKDVHNVPASDSYCPPPPPPPPRKDHRIWPGSVERKNKCTQHSLLKTLECLGIYLHLNIGWRKY